MVENFKHTLNLKMLVCQIDFNYNSVVESLYLDIGGGRELLEQIKDCDIKQKKFNQHYEQAYQKLNADTRVFQKKKNAK